MHSNTHFANGALKTVSDEIGTTIFSYNAFGQKTQEAISSDYIIRVLSRNFDNFGREINYSIGNSKKAGYIYDETNGRLKTMNAVNGGNFEFDYMENTNLQNRITYPNGMVKTTSFEEKRNLITGINYQNGANVISNFSYENDVLGRRTNIGITYDNATKSNDYNYNPRSEVIKAHGDTLNQAFDYDNIGNRITSENNGTTTNYTANNLNQYENVGDFVPLFDEDGNQTKIKTSMGEWLVTYNGENRPIKFTQGTKSIEMKYDYMGRRIEYFSKLNNVVQSHKKFMYDGYTLIQTLNESNQLIQEFAWDPTAGDATRTLVFKTSNETLYYLHDANKNVIGLTNDSGMSIARYEYDTFGNLTTPTSNIDNPFQFSSEYHDSELDLIYYNYRHYSPSTGRWISRDPIEEEGGYNLYGFLENTPLNNHDELGENPAGYAVVVAVVGGVAKWIIKKVIGGLAKKAAEKILKERLKDEVECATIHATYKTAEASARSCYLGMCQFELNKNCALWTASVVGRSLFISKKCDQKLAGSVLRGSATASVGHKNELTKSIKAAAKCCVTSLCRK